MFEYVRRLGLIAVTAAVVLAIPFAQRSTAAGGAGPDSSCTSSESCLQWDNTAKGAGVTGTSAKGDGLVGLTRSNAGTDIHAGVRGVDKSTTSTKDTGVLGVSTRGSGVSGISGTSLTSIAGAGDGVYGGSSFNYGVHGQIEGNAPGDEAGVFGEDLTTNSTAYGVLGISGEGIGVSGRSSALNGVQGTTQSANAAGVYGEADHAFGGYGVAGRAVNDGVGVLADNAGVTGAYPALYIHYGENSCGCPMIQANNNVANVMELYTTGDLVISGTLTQSGATRISTPTHSGHNVVAYAQRTALPAIEDFGESQLVDGQASVRLDPTFASTIDARSPYFVFITADGATSGSLYVAVKTPSGFTVRENGNGRSSVAFDYRIVAKPYGSSAPRLPLYEPPHYRAITLPPAVHKR